ncbi:MAG: GTPase, partial [Patescibacteria group bacterium]
MPLQIGIIGLPNVGKSTLFKALTKKSVPAENYPFTTIDPNVGVVEVPDEVLPQLARVSKAKKIVPAIVEFVDIAGLVKNAHKGEGLGNKFLSNIRDVAAIAHVVRVFHDPDVIHVDNRVDPAADMETIETELALADLESVKKKTETISGKAKSGDKSALAQLPILKEIETRLSQGKPILDLLNEEKSEKIIKEMNL